MPNLVKNISPPFVIRLDWKDYWERFKDAHGEPVMWQGWLLFSDGWLHHASDYAGEEKPPPEDTEELRTMQLAYWRTRRTIVGRERGSLRRFCEELKQSQGAKSMPLRMVQWVQQHDTDGNPIPGPKGRKSERCDVKVEDIENGRRMSDLNAAWDECNKALATLSYSKQSKIAELKAKIKQRQERQEASHG